MLTNAQHDYRYAASTSADVTTATINNTTPLSSIPEERRVLAQQHVPRINVQAGSDDGRRSSASEGFEQLTPHANARLEQLGRYSDVTPRAGALMGSSFMFGVGSTEKSMGELHCSCVCQVLTIYLQNSNELCMVFHQVPAPRRPHNFRSRLAR